MSGLRRRFGPVVLGGLALGALAGVIWWLVVKLPGYILDNDYGVRVTERGLANFFAPDAWFCVIGAIGGLTIGLVCLVRLSRRGAAAALTAALTALAAGWVCWWIGGLLGPGSFDTRLASARPGDFVPIELTLASPVALAIWPFTASVPLLLWSSLSPERDGVDADASGVGGGLS